MDAEVIGNSEAIEAWNGVLFDRFVQFRDIVCTGLGIHGAAALELYPPGAGERVLDIGCGFGDETRRVAGLIGTEGQAVGVDAAERFVDAARAEAEREGVTNASFEVADVQHEVPGSGYDRVFSRMGTMFFENPVAALRNVRSAMRPGGLLTMVVWRQKVENVLFFEAERITERWLTHPDETDEPTCGPGPFSMANADTTSGILRSAGFDGITLTRNDVDDASGRERRRVRRLHHRDRPRRRADPRQRGRGRAPTADDRAGAARGAGGLRDGRRRLRADLDLDRRRPEPGLSPSRAPRV